MTAGLLVALAVLVAAPGPGRRRRRRIAGVAPRRRPDTALLAAGLTPVLGLLVAGTIGVVVGLAIAPLVRRQVATLESARDRRRRTALVRQLPMALDLVAAVLAVGRSSQDAVRIVAARTPAPLGEELTALAYRVRLASDPAAAWRSLDGGPLEVVGRAFARSESSGAAVVPLVRDAAHELRRSARAERREVVGRVAVRTAAPLGLCLLPAFVLVGVAPTVIAVVGSVLR